MKFSFKSISAAIQVAAVFSEMYRGSPLTIKALSDATGLSASYLEQIFSRFRTAGIVSSVRGPGGGYHLDKHDLTVADVIQAVSAGKTDFLKPVFVALDSVKISEIKAAA
ncbi:transcriptional regulator [Salmonella enterica subsp. enterica]|nr:transcriptional regulator [Salmonella enterica subsp. enterica]EAW9772777.1 transcriptional regulator [Salmonella enterica]